MTKYTDSLKDSSMNIRNKSTMLESSEDHRNHETETVDTIGRKDKLNNTIMF